MTDTNYRIDEKEIDEKEIKKGGFGAFARMDRARRAAREAAGQSGATGAARGDAAAPPTGRGDKTTERPPSPAGSRPTE